MIRSGWWLRMAFVLSAASVAVSGVNAYDTFAYEPGSIVGQSAGAPGFVGAWGEGGANGGVITVEPSSLAYDGADSAWQLGSGMFQVYCSSWNGARAGRFLDTDPNGVFGDYINANGNIGKAGQTIYLSYLMRNSTANLFYAFELKRDDLGDNGAILYIGNDNGTELQVCAYRNNNTDPSNLGKEFQWLGPVTPNTTELIVVRIDFGTAGDNVTVYRDPSLDAEPVMTPHLVGSRFLDFDAITMAAWNNGPRTAWFDEICIASTYADAVRFYNAPQRAQNPVPADGTIELAAGSVTLNWTAGSVAPTGYKVYLSDVLDDVVADNDAAYLGTTAGTSFTVNNIATDKTYYWSVTATAEPNDIPGVLWTFETEKTLALPVSQPVSQSVFLGEDASFTFSVTSETSEYYQWFDASGPLTDSGSFSGTQTATLTITNIAADSAGDYYCEVTNSAGTITSRTVSLFVKRLVGYWNLDGTDPNTAWLDLSGTGNDLQPTYTVPASFNWTDGADGSANGALVFDGQFALGTKKADGTMNAIPIGDESYSITAWIKTLQPNNRGIIGWGNYGSNLQVTAIKLNFASEVWHYWWNADMGANAGYGLADDNWHLVSETYDRQTSHRAVYIDGILINQNTPPDHQVQSSVNFLIGKTGWPHEMIEFFDGAIDDVKVYNYALTPVDVAKTYTDIKGGELCAVRPAMDLSGDCVVDISDFAMFAGQWLDCGLVPTCLN